MASLCSQTLRTKASRRSIRNACTLAIWLATGILFLNLLPGQEGLISRFITVFISPQDGQLPSSDKELNAPKTIKIDHEKRQHDRLQRIQKYCNESKHNKEIIYQLPDDGNLFNFVVSEKHKFIFCAVPKTGTSQWKDTLLNVLAVRPVTPNPDLITLFDQKLFKSLKRYPPKERQRMLNSYQTFFFVREPFERILSAYRNKFVGKTTQLYENVGQDIVRKVRKSTERADGSSEYKRPTFDEFTLYLDTLPNSSTWDMHWRPSHQTCYPCAINYNYVGYFETVKEDADYILEKLHLDKMVKFPAYNGSKTPELLRTHYSQIPLDRITRLAEIYRADFEMFGFTYPDPIKKLFKDWV